MLCKKKEKSRISTGIRDLSLMKEDSEDIFKEDSTDNDL